MLELISNLLVANCRVNTAGSNASSQRAQLLYDKWVLDVPKLLDLAAIYAPDHAGLVQQLMQQVRKHYWSVVIATVSWSKQTGKTMLPEGMENKHVAVIAEAMMKSRGSSQSCVCMLAGYHNTCNSCTVHSLHTNCQQLVYGLESSREGRSC